MPVKLIIDTDGGTDDARAIITALRTPGVKVLGITTVFGNVNVEQVTANCSRIVRLCNVPQPPPIFKGASSALLSKHPKHVPGFIHGSDGLGGCEQVEPKLLDSDFENYDKSMHAAEAIIKLVRENPGEVSMVCIGPLTNLALAIKLYPDLDKQLKGVFIMGGNLYGMGNVDGTSAECNFYIDAESAEIVLRQISFCPMYIVPWEVCFDIPQCPLAPKTKYDYSRSLEMNTIISKWYKECCGHIQKFVDSFGHPLTFVDEIALCAAIDRENVVLKSIRTRADVDLQGVRTRGQVTIDWYNDVGHGNIHFVTEYNISRVDDLICAAFK